MRGPAPRSRNTLVRASSYLSGGGAKTRLTEAVEDASNADIDAVLPCIAVSKRLGDSLAFVVASVQRRSSSPVSENESADTGSRDEQRSGAGRRTTEVRSGSRCPSTLLFADAPSESHTPLRASRIASQSKCPSRESEASDESPPLLDFQSKTWRRWRRTGCAAEEEARLCPFREAEHVLSSGEARLESLDSVELVGFRRGGAGEVIDLPRAGKGRCQHRR